MKYAILGNHLRVSALGLGCMGLSEFYGTTMKGSAIETIKKSIELGINFYDTADVYGYGGNEELLGESIKECRREDLVIATKCGIIRKIDDPSARGVCNKREYIRECCEESLRRLDTSYIDLYYLQYSFLQCLQFCHILVHVKIGLYQNQHDFEDLVQVGNQGLISAIKKYDC